MKRKLLIATILAAALAAAGEPQANIDATAAWSKLKSLVGEWQADTSMGTSHVTYELIAGGTSLIERDHAENHPDMLTVYHMDGKRLMLTHYCMAGNQPRMQAQAFNPSTGEIQFRFLDATNLTAPGGGHMHNATLRIVDGQHLNAAWEFYENGKSKMTEDFHFTRVK